MRRVVEIDYEMGENKVNNLFRKLKLRWESMLKLYVFVSRFLEFLG